MRMGLVMRAAWMLPLILVVAVGCGGNGAGGDAAEETAAQEAEAAAETPAGGVSEAELTAEVPELDAFHEVIYQLWHKAWPAKDTAMMKELLPKVQEDVAAVAAAELPGILRDKEPEWSKGVAGLREILEEYEAAAAADDGTRLADAVEELHARFEGMMRIIRPVMKEFQDYHVELYRVYHYHLPDRELEPLRETATAMVDRAFALSQAGIPSRYDAIRETLEKEFHTLGVLTAELKTTAEGDDWTAIEAAVEKVHDQYMWLEELFDEPARAGSAH